MSKQVYSAELQDHVSDKEGRLQKDVVMALSSLKMLSLLAGTCSHMNTSGHQ